MELTRESSPRRRPARLALALALAAVAPLGCGLEGPSGPPASPVGPVPIAPPSPSPSPVPTLMDDDKGGDTPAPPFPGYTLLWHDEFDGAALDETSWTALKGPYRDALQTPDTVAVRDGLLDFTTFTDASGVHHAGRINTAGKFEAAYGYFEARVRFEGASGQWCSFFLYARTVGNPVGDPGTAGAEVDIAEHRARDADGWNIEQLVNSGLIWGGAHFKKAQRLLAHPGGAPLQGAWRTYAVLWSEAGYTFYVDEMPLWSTADAVSHRSEHIYFTCEVDDGGWPGTIPPGGYGPLETSTTGMQVDWVRAWQRGP